MDIKSFESHYKKSRKIKMPSSLDFVEQAFLKSGFNEKNQDFFLKNSSQYITVMRDATWTEYLLAEKKFTQSMAEELVMQSNLEAMTAILSNPNRSDAERIKDIIGDFTDNFAEHLYRLNLSHTQARRSRAGQEFEYIIYKLLIHCGFLCDEQAVIGNDRFQKANLGKAVDCVLPGASEYLSEKHKCILISMKTTLRERWAEVAEEVERSGAKSAYLITLDSSISDNLINNAYSHNIYIVVPDFIKTSKHQKNQKVYGLTQFLLETSNLMEYWGEKDPFHLNESFYTDKISDYEKRINKTVIDSEKSIYQKHINFFKKQILIIKETP